MFKYFIPTKVVFGQGSLDKLHRQKLPGKKALIVITAGKSMRGQGYLARVEEQLDKAGVDHIVFDKIQPNPLLEHVTEAAELSKNEGVDFILGLGGGSSIDSAKAIAVMAANEGNLWDYVGGATGKNQPIPNAPLPVVAITTTAGTGTEADPWAVITKTDTKEKLGIGWDSTYPVLSIVDPLIMLSVPPKLTAYQGFDALFHSTEGYIAKIANPISELYSIDAITRVGRSLAEAVDDGSNVEAREDVALANTIAGFIQSISSCISEHAIEHALSAYHHELPHGAGLIIISHAYYETLINKGAVPEKFVNMAKALGKENATKPEDFLTVLLDLQKACGVDDLKLTDYGFTEDELPGIAKNAHTVMGHMFPLDPVEIDEEATLALLKKSFK
ncbi:MAG: iron-containing alcohol dehydrogenase [Clostridiales Family XIII bacterium]|jgi:alcohol dehydrogenase|nr:iron-containing alcohol dehydrogenase [Clostridiales Family XIII bacterium]